MPAVHNNSLLPRRFFLPGKTVGGGGGQEEGADGCDEQTVGAPWLGECLYNIYNQMSPVAGRRGQRGHVLPCLTN